MGFAVFEQNAVSAARRLDRIDLVIATTAPPQGASIARKIACKRRCPYIYQVLDLYPDLAAALGRVSERSILYRRWLARDTMLMKQAARVVCVGQRMAERIAHTRQIDAARVLAIHDGFDPARLTGGTEETAPNYFRQEYNDEGRFVVQYAGNMGLSHPFETIMEACAALGDREDILFQFVGDGPQRAYIREHLPKNGRLIDYQPADRLGQVLAAADVCLISQHEQMYDKALPYKVYGIFAAGKPTIFIGHGRSEVAEWVRRHEAGLCVEQGQADALVQAICAIKDAPARAEKMGRSARHLAERTLHSRIAAERWTDLIDDVLAEG